MYLTSTMRRILQIILEHSIKLFVLLDMYLCQDEFVRLYCLEFLQQKSFTNKSTSPSITRPQGGALAMTFWGSDLFTKYQILYFANKLNSKC